jgi:hypothetical protein
MRIIDHPTPPVSPVMSASMQKATVLRWAIEGVILAGAGMGAFILPLVISPPARVYDSPLFPLLRTSLEGVRGDSFLAIATVGFLGGLLCRIPALFIGLACMALFPLAAFAEIAADKTSHNLIPFELIMYGVYSIVPLGGGLLGRGVRRLTPLGK